MTAPVRDRLLYKGEQYSMNDVAPLEHLMNTSKDIDLREFGIYSDSSTANWMGRYVGSWEIDNAKLFLVGIAGRTIVYIKNKPFPNYINILNYVFPNQERVFASWFTGKIKCPIGEAILFSGASHYGIHEKDLVFTIENGIIVHEEEFDNSDKILDELLNRQRRNKTMEEQLPIMRIEFDDYMEVLKRERLYTEEELAKPVEFSFPEFEEKSQPMPPH